MDLVPNDLEDIYIALNMRANYIETGTVTLSRNDAIQQKNFKIVKVLEPQQEKLVMRLREIAVEVLKWSSSVRS